MGASGVFFVSSIRRRVKCLTRICVRSTTRSNRVPGLVFAKRNHRNGSRQRKTLKED